MSDERKKVFRAHLTTNPAVGEPCFCHYGYLSDCGEWVDGGKEVELVQAPYIQPHDITHGFASGLYAINGGEMNG